MLSAEPMFQELHGRSVAERISNYFGPRRVAGAMPPLILQAVEEDLRRGVVQVAAFAAYRTDHPVHFQPRLKGVARILPSPVGVIHRNWCWFLAEPRHGQRIDHDVCRHPRLDRPADDSPDEHVENNKVKPALVGPDLGRIGRSDLIRCHRRELQIQQVRRHRQAMLRIRRCLEAALAQCSNAVLSHQPFDALFAGRETTIPHFLRNPRAALGPLEFGMNGTNQRQHLGVHQALPFKDAATLPGAGTAHAHHQHSTQIGQVVFRAMHIDPGVFHRASFANSAAASLTISSLRRNRMISALTRETSICSGVARLVPGPLSLPLSNALTQLRSAYSISPISLATTPSVWPAFAPFTASLRNPGVYCYFGIFFNFPSPSSFPGRYTPSLERRISGGSSIVHQSSVSIRMSQCCAQVVQILIELSQFYSACLPRSPGLGIGKFRNSLTQYNLGIVKT